MFPLTTKFHALHNRSCVSVGQCTPLVEGTLPQRSLLAISHFVQKLHATSMNLDVLYFVSSQCATESLTTRTRCLITCAAQEIHPNFMNTWSISFRSGKVTLLPPSGNCRGPSMPDCACCVTFRWLWLSSFLTMMVKASNLLSKLLSPTAGRLQAVRSYYRIRAIALWGHAKSLLVSILVCINCQIYTPKRAATYSPLPYWLVHLGAI